MAGERVLPRNAARLRLTGVMIPTVAATRPTLQPHSMNFLRESSIVMFQNLPASKYTSRYGVGRAQRIWREQPANFVSGRRKGIEPPQCKASVSEWLNPRTSHAFAA